MEFSLSSVIVRRLDKWFGDYQAIRGADLSADEGEFVTLLGESGCGKTTTLRCIAGLETPTAGHISIGDRIVYDSDQRIEVQPERRKTGMVFQSYALWPHLTVFETILYPLRRQKVRGKEAHQRVREALATVGLEQYATRPATSLSGGQQQRVALARALVSRPDLMLYDEPLSNLDPSLRRQVRDEILRMHRLNGTTSIYVTHDLEEAMHLSDRIIVMQSGLLEQSGTPAEIFARPTNEFVAKFVGFENLLTSTVTAAYRDDFTIRIEEAGVDVTLPNSVTPGSVTPKDEVILAFRSANAVVVSEGDSSGPCIELDGVIERVDFLGSRNDFRIRSGQATIRVAESERDYRRQEIRREPGARVRIEIAAELCSVIPTGRQSTNENADEAEIVETVL